jgi:hypothetical protein
MPGLSRAFDLEDLRNKDPKIPNHQEGLTMKIQFLMVIAALFICCCLGREIAGQTTGNEMKANDPTASSDAGLTANSSTKQNEFNWRGKIAAGGLVEVIGIKGEIQIEASAGNEVEVVALKQGDQNETTQVTVRVEESKGRLRICAAYPTLEGKGASECVESFEWKSISWNGTERELHIGYEDGKKQAIRLAEVQVLFKLRVPAGVNCIARTMRGGITARFGSADIPNTIDMLTLAGNVSLDAPKQINAQVKLSTGGGDISTDFPVTLVGRFPGNGLEGSIGQGGPKISLRSWAGDIELRRAK